MQSLLSQSRTPAEPRSYRRIFRVRASCGSLHLTDHPAYFGLATIFEANHEMRVGYRTGDMWAPKLANTEALAVASQHFVDCLEHGKAPETDGRLGLRVVELIEAATSSMRGKGETVYLPRQGSAS